MLPESGYDKIEKGGDSTLEKIVAAWQEAKRDQKESPLDFFSIANKFPSQGMRSFVSQPND